MLNNNQLETTPAATIHPIQKNIFPVLAFFAILIICTTIILSSWIVSQRTSVIRNLGTEKTQDGAVINTLNVTGSGSVSATPNIATITVSVSETRQTSSDALQQANEKINQIQTIAKQNGVSEKDITTTRFNLNPKYDYTNGEQKLQGQQASQSVTLKQKNVDSEGKKVGTLIDKLSSISNIQIENISFDIENRDEIYSQARKQAFEQAKKRAEEIASISNVKLGSVVNIRDSNHQQPVVLNNAESGNLMKSTSNTSTSVATGQLVTSIEVQVIFEIYPN